MKNAPDYAKYKHISDDHPISQEERTAERNYIRNHHGRLVSDNMELFPSHFDEKEEKNYGRYDAP